MFFGVCVFCFSFKNCIYFCIPRVTISNVIFSLLYIFFLLFFPFNAADPVYWLPSSTISNKQGPVFSPNFLFLSMFISCYGKYVKFYVSKLNAADPVSNSLGPVLHISIFMFFMSIDMFIYFFKFKFDLLYF